MAHVAACHVKMANSIARELSLPSYVTGYHQYNELWILGQGLATEAETVNPLYTFAVAVLLDNNIVGHLLKGKFGPYTKTVSFFLQADTRNVSTVVVTGKAIYLCDKKGMQVPCNLYFSNTHPFLQRLRRELTTMEL